MAKQDESKQPTRRRRTYFDVMANRGYFLAMGFVALFYLDALLSNKGRISVETATIVLVSYWGVSVAYFIFGMCREFSRLYRFFVGRMRQYSRFTWITIFDVNGILLLAVVPAIYFASVGFTESISQGIKSFSIKVLMAFYAASLMLCMVVMAMVVKRVAAKRGVRCSNASAR